LGWFRIIKVNLKKYGFMNSAVSLRDRLYDYIRVADEKKLHAIFNLLEDEIAVTKEWWKDKQFASEIDRRYEALENGTDKGVTVAQLETSINKLRIKKYGR